MADEPLTCFVEIPKGSRNKYEFDHEVGAIKLDRFLFSSMVYPTDYGFIPETLGLDGDPLDAMVCVSEPTFPGCLIDVKPIALFRMEDDKGVDDKVLCVPLQDPAWNHLEELDDLPGRLRQRRWDRRRAVRRDPGRVAERQAGRAAGRARLAGRRPRAGRPALAMRRFETLGKFGIVALIALALFLLPGGGNALDVMLTALSIAFFVAIALLAARLFRENRFTIESLSDRQRQVLYGSIGLALLTFTATRQMFDEGGFGVLAWLALLGLASYGVYWTWRSSQEYG
jgi:inorganic pyrophosphatase